MAKSALQNLYADPLLPISEACRLLAIKHRSTILRRIRSGEIPAVRIGRNFKIRSSVLLKLVKENTWGDSAKSALTKPDR